MRPFNYSTTRVFGSKTGCRAVCGGGLVELILGLHSCKAETSHFFQACSFSDCFWTSCRQVENPCKPVSFLDVGETQEPRTPARAECLLAVEIFEISIAVKEATERRGLNLLFARVSGTKAPPARPRN